MIYEVYRQSDGIDTNSLISKPLRYYTTHKSTAFRFMNEKNNVSNENIWRVAIRIDDRICFDVDITDESNLYAVKNYYEMLFKKQFRVIQTLNGYHLISDKYNDLLEWQYDECRVLYPILERSQLQEYIDTIRRYCRDNNKLNPEIMKENRMKAFSDDFRKSGLYCGHGDFDIYFAISVIHRGFHCIRISKKCKNDIPKVICTQM